MMHSLKEIKAVRKRLGITQQELAKLAGVSQSLITKVESGKLDPTYTKAKNVFDALRQLEEKKSIKAKDLMNKKLVSLSLSSTIRDAMKKMKKHSISQLPIIEEGKCLGLITETDVLEAFMKEVAHDCSVGDIMQPPPPVIDEGATKDVIVGLLRYYPIVLVGEKGNIVGFITKSDLFEQF
jgi:predicted transcriptional regulator